MKTIVATLAVAAAAGGLAAVISAVGPMGVASVQNSPVLASAEHAGVVLAILGLGGFTVMARKHLPMEALAQLLARA